MITTDEQFLEDFKQAIGIIAGWMPEDGTYIVSFTVSETGKDGFTVSDIGLSRQTPENEVN